MSVKQPWRKWVNLSQETTRADYLTTSKQSMINHMHMCMECTMSVRSMGISLAVFTDSQYDKTTWPMTFLHRCDSLQWRHNKRAGVSNHRRLHCLLNCWFGRISKRTSKLRVTGLCAGNSPVTGEFPAQKASKEENVSIWWRHRVICTWNSPIRCQAII